MKTYVLVGAGSRMTYQFAINLHDSFKESVKIKGVYDINIKRAEALVKKVDTEIKVYDDFIEMLEVEKPDTVIIGSIDSTHHKYIEMSMKHGCDVICEKPITIDAEKAQFIINAEKKYGKKLIITFNYRFTYFATRIKQLIKEGTVGKIRSVHFEWLLDNSHGAEYFRRWHRKKENSGGLAVHKCTHHFDLINWLLEDEPETVFAKGYLKNYGAQNSSIRGTNCRSCTYQGQCKYYACYDDDEFINEFYFNCQEEDGYIRDGCVYAEEIDIEDTISALVNYKSGIALTYNLIAYSPYEGYRLSINGDKGRLEVEDFHGLVGPYKHQQIYHIKVFNDKEEEITIKIPDQIGSHGGGDDKMMKMLFGNKILPDPLGHMASSRDGVMSALIGISINQSIKENSVIKLDELIQW